MMKIADTQLVSLEEELRVLRSRLVTTRRGASRRTFASLQGLWKGRVDFSLEAIQRSELQPRFA